MDCFLCLIVRIMKEILILKRKKANESDKNTRY